MSHLILFETSGTMVATMIGHQESSSSNGHQGDMPYLPLSSRSRASISSNKVSGPAVGVSDLGDSRLAKNLT